MHKHAHTYDSASTHVLERTHMRAAQPHTAYTNAHITNHNTHTRAHYWLLSAYACVYHIAQETAQQLEEHTS